MEKFILRKNFSVKQIVEMRELDKRIKDGCGYNSYEEDYDEAYSIPRPQAPRVQKGVTLNNHKPLWCKVVSL